MLLIVISFFIIQLKAEVEIGGNLEAYFASDIKKGDVFRRFLKFDIEYANVFENTELKAIVRAEEDSIRVTDERRIYLREAYINQDIYFNRIFNSLNFKLGKIIYTWGNADELKPVDILNPQDLSFLLFKPIQERKYGVFSADLTLYFTENLFIELIAIPEFVPSEIDSKVFILKDIADIQNNPLYTLNPEVTPDDNLHSANYASRLGLMLFDIDMHFDYYKGYDHLPVMETQILNPLLGTLSFTPVYKQIEMFGFDFQRALFSGISIRGEMAYFTKGKYFALKTDEKNPLNSPFFIDLMKGGNGLVQKKYIEYTAGFDVTRLFIKDLYFNCQLNSNIILEYSDDLSQDEIINSIVSTLEYSFARQKAKVKLREFYNINDKAYATGFESSYKISGSYELNTGCWILEGDEDTYYGQFKDKDMIYLTGKIVF